MKPFKIERSRGQDTICHIKYKCLKPYQINFFKENKLVKRNAIEDDRFLQIVLRILEYETHYKDHLKLYYNNYTKRVSSYEEILEDAKMLEWQCCICDCEIKSEIGNFETSNFLCKDCFKAYGKQKMVDERIVDSSVGFRLFCQQVLLKQQSGHMKYLKMFESGKRIKKSKLLY